MQAEISEQEWQDWLMNPVTKALRAQFADDIARLKNDWAAGRLTNPLKDAEVRGQLSILQQFLDLEHSDIEST